MPALRANAKRFGLIDKPGGRKQHSGDVPIVGGIAVYLSVILAGVVSGCGSDYFLPLLVAFPIVVVGVIDDRSPISPSIRIPVQIVSAIAMMYFGHIQINNIGDITGNGQVILVGYGMSLFTVMCTVGVINSINMIDGVDGLSGSLIALSLLPIAFFAVAAQDFAGVTLLFSLITAIFGFLLYNARLFRSRASVFLGDTGSTFLGFILVWHLIEYTQGVDSALSPVSAGWILGLPLADTIAVMVRRIVDKRSPLAADRAHFHHRLLDAGLGPNKTVLVILSVHLILISIGVVSNSLRSAEPLFFWLFVLFTISHFLLTPRLIIAFATVNNLPKLVDKPNNERTV